MFEEIIEALYNKLNNLSSMRYPGETVYSFMCVHAERKNFALREFNITFQSDILIWKQDINDATLMDKVRNMRTL